MNDVSNAARGQANRDDLLSPATQIVRNRADYLGEGQDDVGQRIADDKLELFVAVDPAQAMLQQFAALQPEFIALHDVGSSQSLRLLGAIAGALNTRVQTLSIRRQGHGVALAVLPFVELPGRGNQHLRVYSTDIDTDSQSRKQLASVLLGHARLGVLLVGEMPGHLLTGALQPVREAVVRGPWPNRDLLMVPLGSPGALAAQAAAINGPRGLNVRVTPQAASSNDAWGYVTGAWNRLRESSAPAAKAPLAQRPMPSSTSEAPTEAMPLPGAEPDPQDLRAGRWADYLRACQAIKGLVSACVFEARSGHPLAHCGARPDARHLVTEGLKLFNAMAECGRGLGLGPSQPDAAITLTGHHLLMHPLPGHPGIVMHAVLDASVANLTLARMQLQRVDTAVLGEH
ncbi:hypothetical protein [Rubrivivax albus]|uniref:Uncharacterized protein n=1 Tax=Rubrivivax albus TaxID=2499835 RepID=A0A437JTH4_9BURK|nr:hypothetical protein [Rubrivivax albus]RVT50368.1 hypothetical protein ENE75_15225 [Rubrivivax albus]